MSDTEPHEMVGEFHCDVCKGTVQNPLHDTEPLDLDAIEQILDNARNSTSRITSLMAAYRLVDYDVPALIAEVRRLREEAASKEEAAEFFRELASMVEQDIDDADDVREFRQECSDAFKALGVSA